ncbi:MAG: SDR family oxidoreductase [Chloroherpetonaceae bacterium]|nr:SDR family oxidoreductase [Chloroherpetonaceae bacterium]
MELKGKTALITGSSRGIGKAIALELARLGANIAVNYAKNKEEAENTVQELQQIGVQSMALQANIAKHEEIVRLFAEVDQTFGRLDIFIHNAAKGVFGVAHRIGPNGFELAMATGPKAFLFGAQEAYKRFGDKGGIILAISSIGNLRVLPDYAAVGTAKAGIENLVRYLAAEMGHKNIRVNAISAGPIDTEALLDFKEMEKKKEAWIEKTPLGRLGNTQDVANIAAFLCSEKSRWIHGQVIIADGGYTLY